MIVVDVYNARFHRVYTDRDSLSLIMDRDDIYVYELSVCKDGEEMIHLPVYHREETWVWCCVAMVWYVCQFNFIKSERCTICKFFLPTTLPSALWRANGGDGTTRMCLFWHLSSCSGERKVMTGMDHFNLLTFIFIYRRYIKTWTQYKNEMMDCNYTDFSMQLTLYINFRYWGW